MLTYSIDKPLIHCVNVLGECPLWDPIRETLFWIDIDLGFLYEFQLENPDLKIHKIGQKLGCIALTDTNQLLLATELGFAFYRPDDPPPKTSWNNPQRCWLYVQRRQSFTGW